MFPSTSWIPFLVLAVVIKEFVLVFGRPVARTERETEKDNQKKKKLNLNGPPEWARSHGRKNRRNGQSFECNDFWN